MGTNTGFAHLHVHTEHSPLDGLSKLADACEKVAADGNTALAITDHGTLGGAWKFASAARKAGIKPIIGTEAYLALSEDWRSEPDRHDAKTVQVERDDASSGDRDEDESTAAAASKTKAKRNQHITLLAKNATGWTNLIRMANKANESFWVKPLMDFNLIKEHGEGIIVLTGCLGGPVLGPVSRGDMDEARSNLKRLIDAVGKENVFVEVMEHGIPAETAALPKMAELAAEFGLDMVATNDAHYVHADQAQTHEAWLAVQSGKTLDDPKRFQFHGAGFHLRTETEMRELRTEGWWQTAVSNTVMVAALCDDVVPQPHMRLPDFPLPEGFDSIRQYYVQLVREGAIQKFGTPIPEEVSKRLQSEMAVIESAGFMSYFLIVMDVIDWARSQGIRVGPGRGSAAGALTSYCLRIVSVDPLENNLLFERFLEPGRKGMPDIDVDFEKLRRHEVLQYLAERWGGDRVARIGSFSAAKTRRALRDAARLLEQRGVGDALSKAVPMGDGGQPYNFRQLADETDPAGSRFRDVLASFGEAGQSVVDLAKGFAGTVNGESIHACGTLIADTDLRSLVPLREDRSKSNSSGLSVITQWDGDDIDKFGLLKLDVLGLRNLDVISQAAKFIEQTTGVVIDPDNLPHPNTKNNPRVNATWELLRSGRTAGIFQMESSGMANLARQIQPDRLSDLSAVVALFRPGPLGEGMHLMYADRKSGEQDVSYARWTSDPAEAAAIDSVLGETYGVFVYQEQLMRLGTVVGGFDVSMRSQLRKAVSKKIKAEMEMVGEALIEGAPKVVTDEVTGEVISMAFSRQTASKLFESMKYSASYLFNASHSFAYAQLAYVTAYLKANWPAEYGAAILAMTDDAEKRQSALRALAEEGIDVQAPDVNRSHAGTYPIGDKTVLLGLSEIKGVGQSGAAIAEYRMHTDATFDSIHDLMAKVIDDSGKSLIDVGTVEGLIEAGALDSFGSRLGLMRIARASKDHTFDVPADEWGALERSTRQRQRLGVIMGVHPLDIMRQQITGQPFPLGNKRDDEMQIGQRGVDLGDLPSVDNDSTFCYGVLAEWSERAYSKGRMANFTLESADISIRGVLWDDTLRKMRSSDVGIPTVGSVVIMSGKVQIKTQDLEDEEGNVTGTVETKELMAFQMVALELDDGETSIPRVQTRTPLRRHMQLLSIEPEPVEAPVVVVAPEPVAAPEPPKPVTAPSTGSTVMVPVVGVCNSTSSVKPWTSARDAHEAINLAIGGPGLKFVPAATSALRGCTYWVVRGKERVLLVVNFPSSLAGTELPPEWDASGDLPTWDEVNDNAPTASVAEAVHEIDDAKRVAEQPVDDVVPYPEDEWDQPVVAEPATATVPEPQVAVAPPVETPAPAAAAPLYTPNYDEEF